MTNKEEILITEMIQNCLKPDATDPKRYDKARVLSNLIAKNSTGSCTGCRFYEREEWDMPCAKCARGCKDYFTGVQYV